MAHSHKCRVSRLVTSEVADIAHCSCGMVHLHMGPVSLRVNEHAFSEFAESVNMALIRMKRRARDREPAHMVQHGDFVSG